MSNPTGLVDRYLAMWNETDGERRRNLIARTWTQDASYLDPMRQGEGHAGIDAMVRRVHERCPGRRFHRTGDVHAHHDRVRFSRELAPEDIGAVVSSTDFGMLAADDRLEAVVGFFDKVSAAAPGR